MRKLAKAIAVLLLCTVAHASVDVEYIYNTSRDQYVAWSWACELVRDHGEVGSCVGVRVPKVEYTNMNQYRGMYKGGDTIYINAKLRRGPDLMSTLIHEMIHYIHEQSGIIELPAPVIAVCWSEQESFRLVDKWLVMQGYPEMQRGPYWWLPYPHCWQFFTKPVGEE